MNDNKLEIKLLAEAENLSKGLEKTIGKIDLLSATTKKAAREIHNMSAMFNMSMIVNSLSRLTGYMSGFINSAIDYTEELNLFNVIFDNIEKNGKTTFSEVGLQAERFQNKLNEAFGTNMQTTRRYQGLFQSMAESMGIDESVADVMSENMTKLTYDLASLFNTSEKKAAESLRAGVYAGQTKPLRGYGVDVTQNTMKPILAELGIDRQVSELNQAEKQLLRYIAVLRQSQNAMGDFANTIESPANQLKIFRQQCTETKAAVGSLFLGLYARILPYANAILMVIKEVTRAIATFFGIELQDYNTGIASYDDGLDDYSTGIDGIGDSAGTAAKKIKELKRETLGFDQINNLTTPTTDTSGSGGSSGSGGLMGGIDQRLLDAIHGYDNGMDKVKMKANEIRDKIMEWLGFTKQVDEETGKVSYKFNHDLKDGVYEVARAISENMTNALLNIPWDTIKTKLHKATITLTDILNGITDGANWGAIGSTLGNALETYIENINTFFKNYNWGNLGKGLAEGVNNFVNELDPAELGQALVNKLNAAFKTLNGFLGKLDMKQIATKFRLAIANALTDIDWGAIGGTIINGLKKVFDTSIPALFTTYFGINAIGKYVSSAAAQNIGTSYGIQALFAGYTPEDAAAYGTAMGTKFGKAFNIGFGIIAAEATILVQTLFELHDAREQYFEASRDAWISHFEMIKAQQEDVSAASTRALQNYKDEIAKTHGELNGLYEQSATSITRAEELTEKLIGLIDENGNVVGSEKEVKSIIDNLNKTLGTNIELDGKKIKMNGKVITSNDDLRKSIEKVIVQKRLEILLDTYKDNYIKSLQKQKEWEDKINAAKENMNLITKQYYENGQKNSEAYQKAMEEEYKKLENFYEGWQIATQEVENYESGVSAMATGTAEDMKESMKKISGYSYTTSTEMQNDMEEWHNKVYGETEKAKIDISSIKGSVPKELYTKLGVKNQEEAKKKIQELIDKASSNPKLKLGMIYGNDTIKNFISKVFNGHSGAIQIALDLITKVTGGKAMGGVYQNGSWSNIPQYAYGGIPTHGTMFVAGEAGAEIVGNVGGRTEVLNSSQLASVMYSAVVKAMEDSSGNRTDIYFHSNPSVVIDEINRQTIQTGVSPIMI